MNKTIGVSVGIVALIVIVGGVYASMDRNDTMMTDQQAMNEETMKEEAMPAETMQSETDSMKEKEDMMMAGSYEAYSSEKIARAETGDVVLFFHASWCPSCRGLNTDIEANLNAIPEGVSILKVDYDKETELKKKYGVTYQHTLVQVDKDGSLIKKWSGSAKLANVVAELQ